MNRHTLLNIAATAIGLAALAGSAVGQEPGEHKLISPQDIKWGPAPPSLPPSAQLAVLYGDPGKEGMFSDGRVGRSFRGALLLARAHELIESTARPQLAKADTAFPAHPLVNRLRGPEITEGAWAGRLAALHVSFPQMP